VRSAYLLSLSLLTAACSVAEPPASTGGTDAALGVCGRGLVVVATDYQSTNVSLVDTHGEVLSSSFVSSASEQAGLSAPLSGDVVAPSGAQLGEELVLIDRYPASVISWLDVASATVRAQLNVSTGFVSNPQDYLAVAPGKAYVSRFESNNTPGGEIFDEGGDVLIIDPTLPAISGRIDLREAMSDVPGYLPRANRMLAVGARIFVLLSAYDEGFADSAPSRVVEIDAGADAIVGVTVLDGLHGCAGLAVSPNASSLAVSCSGRFSGASASPVSSGLVILSTDSTPPREVDRFAADELLGRPLGFSLDFADERILLLTALGELPAGGEAAVVDTLFELDSESRQIRTILSTPSLPFELGEVRCMTALGNAPPDDSCGCCFVADAERARLHRLRHDGEGYVLDASITIDTKIGLPPRMLGRF